MWSLFLFGIEVIIGISVLLVASVFSSIAMYFAKRAQRSSMLESG